MKILIVIVNLLFLIMSFENSFDIFNLNTFTKNANTTFTLYVKFILPILFFTFLREKWRYKKFIRKIDWYKLTINLFIYTTVVFSLDYILNILK